MKKNKAIGIIIGAIMFSLTYYGTQKLLSSSSYEESLKETAEDVNKSCPFLVDEFTQLDNTVVLPENTFQYNYTLINLLKSEIDTNYIIESLFPGIINNVKTNPDMEIFRKNKTTINYYYKDKTGVFVTKLSVTPDLYLN